MLCQGFLLLDQSYSTGKPLCWSGTCFTLGTSSQKQKQCMLGYWWEFQPAVHVLSVRSPLSSIRQYQFNCFYRLGYLFALVEADEFYIDNEARADVMCIPKESLSQERWVGVGRLPEKR